MATSLTTILTDVKSRFDKIDHKGHYYTTPKSTTDKNGKSVVEMDGKFKFLADGKNVKYTLRAYSDKWVIIWGKQDGTKFFYKISGKDKSATADKIADKIAEFTKGVQQSDQHKSTSPSAASKFKKQPVRSGRPTSTYKKPDLTGPKLPKIGSTTYMYPTNFTEYAASNKRVSFLRIVGKASHGGSTLYTIGAREVLFSNGTWGYRDQIFCEDVSTYNMPDLYRKVGFETGITLETTEVYEKINEIIKTLIAHLNQDWRVARQGNV